MRKIVAEIAPKPRSDTARNIAWVYAAVLAVMAIGQLFAFEKFVPMMDDYWLPGGHGTGSLVACLVVVTEIFALPFLLRMRLSPLMRWFSLLCSVAAPLIWLLLGLFSALRDNPLTNSGMLGDKIHVSTNVQLLVSAVLVLVAFYVAYGLWPNLKKK